MAARDDPAELMPAAELKPLLKLSRRRPVSCAIAMAKDRTGVVLLHRRTKPRKLMAELRRQAAAAGIELNTGSIRFGRAEVDGGSDSMLVRFTVNKPAPEAMRRSLLAQVRPAGFQRCEITVDEGLETEAEGDDDGDDEDGDDEEKDDSALRPAAAGGAALMARLLALARQVAAVTAADPSRKQPLVQLVSDTRASIKGGELQVAESGLAALRQALQAGLPGSAADRDAPADALSAGNSRHRDGA